MKAFMGGLLLGLLLVACSSFGFNYRYYGIVPSQGKLLGPTQKEDLPLTECEPDAQDQGKCAVFFRAELQRLEANYLKLEEELKACQQGRRLGE